MKWFMGLMLLCLPLVTSAAPFDLEWDVESSGPYSFNIEALHGVCSDGNNGMIAAGRQWNTVDDRYEGVYVRFDENGDIIWRHNYTVDQYDRVFYDVCPVPGANDEYLMVGYRDFQSGHLPLVVHINGDGDVLHGTFFNTVGGGELRSVSQDGAGFIAAGKTDDSLNPFGLVVRLDDVDSFEWTAFYNYYDQNYLYDIEALPGGGYISAGYGRDTDLGVTHAWTMRIDSDQSVLFSNHNSGIDNSRAYAVVQTGTGEFISVGTVSHNTDDSDFLAMRYDENGFEVWENTYGLVDMLESAWSVEQSPAGGYAMFGYQGDAVAYLTDAAALHIDESGNLLDFDVWEDTGSETIWASTTLNNGDFGVVGNVGIGLAINEDLWAARIHQLSGIDLLIKPVSPPVYVPFTGGTFQYEAYAYNFTNSPVQLDAWVQVMHVPSNLTVEVRFFPNVTLGANSSAGGIISQYIPIGAPEGEYLMTAFLGDHPWSQQASDDFTFYKTGPVSSPNGNLDLSVFDQPELWISSGSFGETPDLTDSQQANQANRFALGAAYPNPFNPTTQLSVTLPNAAELTVTVFNVTGQQVAELANGRYTAGTHSLTFDAASLAGGVYFVRATVPGELTQMQKVMLVK